MPIADLASALNLDHSSASRLVSRLAAKKFVALQPSKTDGRSRVLSITEAGKTVLGRLHKESDRRVEAALALLSSEEQQAATQGMRFYARALRRARGQNGSAVRPIRKNDDATIAAIIRKVMPEFGADGPGFALHDAEVDFMTKAYAGKDKAYFVIELDGKVVGGGGFAPLIGGGPGVCELRKMYLLPESRGFGLGEKLLQRCLAEAREAGFKSCYLETTSKMIQAQSLYQKMGFKPLRGPRGNTGHCACDRWYEMDLKK
jgi:putative acetyltransferase